jgi:hypothetical protein
MALGAWLEANAPGVIADRLPARWGGRQAVRGGPVAIGADAAPQDGQ